jgi:hypothetical protein
LVAEMPLQRMGRPEENAQMIMFSHRTNHPSLASARPSLPTAARPHDSISSCCL